MAVYKTRWFDRWGRKQGLPDSSLCAAVREMSEGLIDADLGGGLVKKRVARPGQGKSGGFRTLVATNKGNRWVFVYGFEKSARGNIASDEAETLKKLATDLLSQPAPAIAQMRQAGKLIEVDCDAKD
jgi:hypothetical protein